jgi:SAM-dependent MidA family methyltransferase
LEEKVAWCVGISDLRAKDGVVFSNELIDAFPVRRVCYRDGNWREMVVVLDPHRRLVWSEREIGDALLRAAVPALPAIDGYTTEVNLRARAWMEDIGSGLKRGYIFTVDYGFPASVYYAPYRNAGTLTAYHEHRRMENSLLQPGRMDLTAHVDFTTLAAAGETVGWITLGFLDQQHFLLGVAHDELEGSERYPVGIQESTGAWNMLTHPNHLGTRFQVLVQGKDAPADLSGLRYGGSGASLL